MPILHISCFSGICTGEKDTSDPWSLQCVYIGIRYIYSRHIGRDPGRFGVGSFRNRCRLYCDRNYTVLCRRGQILSLGGHLSSDKWMVDSSWTPIPATECRDDWGVLYGIGWHLLLRRRCSLRYWFQKAVYTQHFPFVLSSWERGSFLGNLPVSSLICDEKMDSLL